MLILAINPSSGRGKARRLAQIAEDFFSSKGIDVTCIEGVSQDDFRQKLRASLSTENVSGVVAFGGDGFVHEIIQHIALTQVPLGVIPCGTGNDFARSLGVHGLSLSRQLSIIWQSQERYIDLGKVGDKWFGAILSNGFDALVNDRANQMHWPRGRMKYNLAMVEKLIELKPRSYHLKIDSDHIDVEATLVTVANGSSYGGGMKICPEARIDDGYFDLMILGKVSRLELLKVFPKVYTGKHVGHPAVSFYRAAKIEILGSGPSFADGELVASLPLSTECVSSALKVWAA